MNMIDRPATGEAPQTMIGPGGGWAVPLAALAVALLAWGVLFYPPVLIMPLIVIASVNVNKPSTTTALFVTTRNL